LATQLRDAGLAWRPAPGDRFVVPDRDLDDTPFVLSDMTVEVHELPKGTVIGFNGTTEWALDDVDKDEAIWLPREDQLRELLGKAFVRLDRVDGGYRVVVADEVLVEYRAGSAPDAYGRALLATLRGPAAETSGN
jgi:hypothetical protein